MKRKKRDEGNIKASHSVTHLNSIQLNQLVLRKAGLSKEHTEVKPGLYKQGAQGACPTPI